MASTENQYYIAEEIDKQFKNYKKDGAERKGTLEYFKKRENKLEELWGEFQFNHDQLTTTVSQGDPYFQDQQYESTRVCYMRYKSQMASDIQKLQDQHQSTSSMREEQREELRHEQKFETPSKSTDRGSLSKLDETLRKQMINFKAFARTIANINVADMTDKWEFEDSLKILETRWSAIDKLHWEIDSELDDGDLEYDSKFTSYEIQYNTMKKNINKRMWSVAHREKSTPKIDIPVFSGNYTQWVSFKDLFNETIHENPTLSHAQKMQFLKSKLRGEAERLIQHLSISSENYLTCWEILNHRYNNIRLIFTSHMNLLFSLPNIQQISLAQVKKLHDVTIETMHAIKNLGVDTCTWDPIIVHILTQKLDSETYSDYVESVKNPRSLPVLQELLDYLESKFTILETSSRRKQDVPVQKSIQQSGTQQSSLHFKKQPFNNQKFNTGHTAGKSYNVTSYKCPLCKNDHGIYNCRQFLQMPNDKKLITIKRLDICLNCLFHHNGKQCSSSKTCRKCSGQHNTLIHDALEESRDKQSTSGRVSSTSHASQEDFSEVLLATAQIKVRKADGTYSTMRALIDQGSQISIITEHAAQILALKRSKCQGVVFGVGQKENTCKGKTNITFTSMYNDHPFNVDVIIMKNLIKNLPNKTFTKPSWSNIQNINLADPEFFKSRPIDILLGADIYANIMLEGIIKGNSLKQPMAQHTYLGWLLCGSAQTFQCNVILNNIEDIQQFWEIEDITEEDDLSSEDIHCIEYFQKTTKRKEDGRYEVSLPKKSNFQQLLGNSKHKAIAQFHNLEQKFKKHTHLATAYKSFMNEYIQLQHMKHESYSTSPECYLPHHGVERAESATTKYRVVFNASAKTSSGWALNDLLYKGPNLQKDLQSLLLKWRQYKYAFTADVEKQFRQISIAEEDQHLQKIIWRESLEQPLQTFQLTTVTYGTKPAPFLAMMTLKRLASDERDSYPEAATVLEESFYMDDLCHGSHLLETGQKLVSDLNSLLQTGGFNLRKWCSNNPSIFNNLPKEMNNENLKFSFKTNNTSKTLGLGWNPEQDEFTFQCDFPEKTITKFTNRKLLSEISKIFDPLGWLGPITLKMKLLFQRVWTTDFKWDKEVPNNIYKEWCQLRSELNIILNTITIPRWILTTQNDVIELHGFCDASIEAYGCVIYSRTQKVMLVAAKTKVVPIKKTLTLPKLELSAAFLLTKLFSKVKQTLQPHNINMYAWTDSQVVLGWLRGEPGRWKPFVANRVKKITEIIPEQCWNYVKSNENPADAASRGLFPQQLKEHNLWWSGPAWLSTFKSENITKQQFETNQEEKLHLSNTIITQSAKDDVVNIIITKFSSFNKMTRVMAWIHRALTPKHKHRTSYLTLQELRNAKLTIIKYVQKQEFATEMDYLRNHGHIARKCKLLTLNPFIDHNNILRVGGRLSQATINFEMKHPKIIPQNTLLAERLIDQAHKLTLHGGPRLTLANLRQEYWIMGGNNTVKKHLRNCVTCRKQDGKTQQQLMGDLPSARSNVACPFYHTGVDYTGFVEIKLNKGRTSRSTKGYVSIFVCMVTKAVHLELVSELSASAFLAALRRMAARRGTPHHLYSDNGTNFVGANRALKEEWQQLQNIFNDYLLSEISNMSIEWHFIAPAWPSAGGIWERAVRSLKHHLRRVVGEQRLTFEEYTTILTQIEACLNSRPLCPLTENIEDLDFLTPAHFLTGRSGLTVINTTEDARSRWHLTQTLFLNIWKRWKGEYLSQLTARRKWCTPQRNLEVGDMVVIHEDNLPPGKWAMGRIVNLHPGKDGYVRVVTVKTASGEMKRPAVKLSVLPIETKKEQKQHNLTSQQQVTNVTRGRSSNNKSTLSTITLMIFCIMNIFTATNCFQVTPLNEKQGLYFDRVTNMYMIRDEWKIVAFYDMEPYWEGTAAFDKFYNQLENTCNHLKQYKQCEILMLQLSHTYNELHHNNEVLLNQHNSARSRMRRGLINGVGYLANSLFGVLDDRFAEQYQRDIELVRNNQRHLEKLWKNQTSLVEAEYNLIKRTENTIQKQHKLINQHLLTLDKAATTLGEAVSTIEVMTKFTLSAMTANNLLSQLKNIQDSLLDTLTSVYDGNINMHLIDAQQLQNELGFISSQLLKEVSLPIDNVQTGMSTIYKLMKAKARITKTYLIIELRVPLISRDQYVLYNIHSVPYQTRTSMVTLTPIGNHLAINLHKDSYLLVTDSELQHCTYRDATTCLCPHRTPIYKMKTDQDFCVKSENKKGDCKKITSVCENKWISLTNINQYLYFCCNLCQVRTICENHVTAHQLSGANIININSSCLVKTENFTIYTHKQQENRIDLTYHIDPPVIDPINSVINITLGKITEGNLSDTTTNDLHQEIEQKLKLMKQYETFENNISFHDVHHYTAIWSIGVVVLIIVILLVCQRNGFCSRKQQHSAPAAVVVETPTAVPAVVRVATVDTARIESNQNALSSDLGSDTSDSVKGNLRSYKNRGTTPVLRKIVFSDDS